NALERDRQVRPVERRNAELFGCAGRDSGAIGLNLRVQAGAESNSGIDLFELPLRPLAGFGELSHDGPRIEQSSDRFFRMVVVEVPFRPGQDLPGASAAREAVPG